MTIDEIDAIIMHADSVNDNENKVLSTYGMDSTLLRRRESQLGVTLPGFPKSTRTIPYDNIYDLRVTQELPNSIIARILQVPISTVLGAIKHYGITVTNEAAARMRKKAYAEASRSGKKTRSDPVKAAEILSKTRRTSMKRYGTPSPMQSQEIKQKVNNTLQEKYGKGGSPFANASVRAKAKKTMMARYGVDSSWKSEEVKEKIRKANLERYGNESAMRNADVRKKVEQTNLERYGVKWNTVSPQAREKAKETYMKHYGVDNPSQSPEVLDKIARSMQRGESANERMVSKLLDSLDIDYLTNDHDIIGSELDFVIPSSHVAIEVSPVFTHNSNEEQVLTVKPKSRGYHKKKHDLAEQQGYELITLSDPFLVKNRWESLTEPFISMKVSHHTDRVFYARETIIEHAESRESRHTCSDFIEHNHFSGNTPAKEYYSIRDKRSHEMLGAFSLRKTVNTDEHTMELSRLAWGTGIQVRYGLSKIVAEIRKSMPTLRTLISFSDNNMGNGKSYEAAGFTYLGDTDPALHFINIHDPMDSYSWQVATPWGARSGVISRLIHPMDVTKKEAKHIVETQLPHRTDDGIGYFSYYDTGSKKWSYDLEGAK